MKQRMKQLILSACTFILLGHIHFASADIASDTDRLLNWAETTYPNLFPSHQATQNIEPWIYRYYPESQIYAGVNKNDNDVYVLGGNFGNTPTRIDTLANLISQIPPGSNIAACDTSNVPTGIAYSQSGNVVTVTTNGQCIPADLNTNICQAPQQTTPSGISILSSNTATSSKIEGLKISIPGFPDPLNSLNTNAKHCTINAAAETTNLVVNSDLCFDITSTITATFGDSPIEGIEVTPPVKYFTAGTYTSQTVADCFTTDATTISDAFTGEVWVKQNGNFVKVSN